MKFLKIFIIVLILLLVGFFLYIDLNKKEVTKIDISKINRTVIGIGQINLMLYSLGAYELHNPPLSKDTPKIEIVIGNEVYSAEIINKAFSTKKASINNADLRITTSREEFLACLNSDIKTCIQKSVRDGKTKIETISDSTELALKGYLSLYQEQSS